MTIHTSHTYCSGVGGIGHRGEVLEHWNQIVFMLFVVDGYSHKEISKELNIALETSKWHVKEARTFFKNNY